MTALLLYVSFLGQQHAHQQMLQFDFKFASVTSLVVPLAALIAGLVRSGCGNVGARRVAPLRAHFVLGLLNWGSFYFSALAPLHMSMPIFLASKSVKILPTMVIAALWLRKRFRMLDWAAALLAGAGLMLCLSGAKARREVERGEPSLFGVFVMLGALLCDGASANTQEAVIIKYKAATSEFAVFTYGVASILSVLHGVVAGDLRAGVARVLVGGDRAAVGASLVMYAAASTGATWATLDLISNYGASPCMFLSALAKTLVILSTTEKLSQKQSIGIVSVFAAAFLAAFARSGRLERWVREWHGTTQGAGPSTEGVDVDAATGRSLETTGAQSPLSKGEQRSSSSSPSLRRRSAAGASPSTTDSSPFSPLPDGSVGDSSPFRALVRLRAPASRALTTVSSAVLGVDRPPLMEETLVPSEESRSRRASIASSGSNS